MYGFLPPIRPNIVPLNWDNIINYGTPKTASQPEAYRDVLFDTQTYVSTTTTELVFFNTAQTDKTLGNMPQASSLPAATAFAVSAISCELAIGGEAGGAAGGNSVADASKLLITARPILTLTISDKTYGPWPLVYCGAAGGLAIYGAGTTTADVNAAFSAGMGGNGGWFLGNSLMLLPNVQFAATIKFSAAQTLSGNRNIRIALHGTKYRRVV